jgi:hypothetical protein
MLFFAGDLAFIPWCDTPMERRPGPYCTSRRHFLKVAAAGLAVTSAVNKIQIGALADVLQRVLV